MEFFKRLPLTKHLYKKKLFTNDLNRIMRKYNKNVVM